jgi:Domain of unknown function (DUF5666)
MQLTFEPARLTGFAILAVAGATALSVGACSSSNDAKSPATSSPASAKAKDSVHGLIASVSGNAVQVTQTTGTATVDVSPSTKVTENSKAQMTDIAAGNCIRVGSAPQSAPAPDGAVTAKAVFIMAQGGDGKCPQPKTAATSPAQPSRLTGTVAAVAGNTIHVAVTDAHGNPSQIDVTVTDTTQYVKQASATSQAIAQGKCVTAQGTKDGSGTLQATVVALGPANDGKCPTPAAGQHPH